MRIPEEVLTDRVVEDVKLRCCFCVLESGVAGGDGGDFGAEFEEEQGEEFDEGELFEEEERVEEGDGTRRRAYSRDARVQFAVSFRAECSLQ